MDRDDRLIKYDGLAPLEYLARAKCAINLYDNEKIRELFGDDPRPDARIALEHHFQGKITKLRLPRSTSKKLMRTCYHVADDISRWIKYHDEEIFNVESEVHPMAAGHLESIVWTPRGTINYLASANKLIRRDVGDDVRLRLAYAYGLSDHMIELSDTLLKNSDYLEATFPKHERGLEQRERSAIYYWICYILSNTSELETVYEYEIRNHLRIEMLLFHIFFPTPNYVLIKRLWNELNRAEKMRLFQDLVNANASSDLKLFLLSQLEAEDQRTVIGSRIPCIYKILVNDIYPRTFYDDLIDFIWQTMTNLDFVKIIEQLFESIETCKEIFKNLWSSVSITFRHKTLLTDYYQNIRLKLTHRCMNRDRKSLVDQFDWIGNEDVVELILTDATPVQRRYYLESNSSIAYASEMIKKGKWTTLESFVRQFIPDREDILQYKSNVLQGNDFELIKYFYEANPRISQDFYRWSFESKSRMNRFLMEKRESMWYTMSSFFIAKENIYKVESFLEWCLLSPSERARWLQTFRLDAWYKLIQPRPRVSLIQVEYFLDWSFKTADKMFKSKYILPSQKSLFVKYVCVLIKENKFKLLDDLLNWCFLYDQSNIRKFKIDFQDDCEVEDFVDIVKSVVMEKNDFHIFDNFFGDWFDDEKDFRTFRIKIGRPRIASWIVAEFISMGMPERADEFFKWCFNFNDNQMIKFKLKILADESIEDIVANKSEIFVENFVQWIDPPVEQYREFERRFLRNFRSNMT